MKTQNAMAGRIRCLLIGIAIGGLLASFACHWQREPLPCTDPMIEYYPPNYEEGL